MSNDFAALAISLDEVARTVPGVAAIYSSSPAIVTTVRQIGAGTDPASLVTIHTTDDGCHILANIAVKSSIHGPQTAAAVSAALLDALPADLAATVQVRVSRILA